MLGHEVWFAPRAVVYHKHHGTSGSESPARVRAFERNALRMLYALLEDRTLQRVLPAALLLAADRILLDTPFSRADEGNTQARGWPAPRYRLQPRAIKIRLLHALSQRGARRQYPIWTNLRRVGISGFAAALADTVTDLRRGWEGAGAREAYLIERTGPTSIIDGRHELLPSVTVAKLMGIGDFLAMLPDLSRRRAWLQARRRLSDAEIVRRFGGHWTSAVPSTRLDLHVDLRNALLGVLRVDP
jgi:hypothetical protein